MQGPEEARIAGQYEGGAKIQRSTKFDIAVSTRNPKTTVVSSKVACGQGENQLYAWQKNSIFSPVEVREIRWGG